MHEENLKSRDLDSRVGLAEWIRRGLFLFCSNIADSLPTLPLGLSAYDASPFSNNQTFDRTILGCWAH